MTKKKDISSKAGKRRVSRSAKPKILPSPEEPIESNVVVDERIAKDVFYGTEAYAIILKSEAKEIKRMYESHRRRKSDIAKNMSRRIMRKTKLGTHVIDIKPSPSGKGLLKFIILKNEKTKV